MTYRRRLLAVSVLVAPIVAAVPAQAAQAACAHIKSDFDGDGRSDVAAGAPSDNASAADGAGIGSVSVRLAGRQQVITSTDLAAGYSGLGTSLASGYFDGDCHADLVVGAN